MSKRGMQHIIKKRTNESMPEPLVEKKGLKNVKNEEMKSGTVVKTEKSEGRKVVGNNSIESLNLQGELIISQSADIEVKDSISIGKITNPNTTDNNMTVKYNLEGNTIIIGDMIQGDNNKSNFAFDFIIGPGSKTTNGKKKGESEDDPIIFKSSINDVKSRWYTKLRGDSYEPGDTTTDQGYYVGVFGQYFDGNTSNTGDDDNFGFWKSNGTTDNQNDVTIVDNYANETGEGVETSSKTKRYTTSSIGKNEAQYYFSQIPGILIRTDKYCTGTDPSKLDNYSDVDIYLAPGIPKIQNGTIQNPEDENNCNSIIAKYRNSDNAYVTYTGTISYPFRKDDDKTVNISKQTRDDVANEYTSIGENIIFAPDDMYSNDLVFESLYHTKGEIDEDNPTDTTEIKIEEQIRMKIEGDTKKSVYYDDDTKCRYSIKEQFDNTKTTAKGTTNITDVRMNKGKYSKYDSINGGYIEQACDKWLITRECEYKDESDIYLDLTYDAECDSSKKNDMTHGKFGEQTVSIKSVYVLNKDESTHQFSVNSSEGSLACNDLQLRGCSAIELDKGCKIKCANLII